MSSSHHVGLPVPPCHPCRSQPVTRLPSPLYHTSTSVFPLLLLHGSRPPPTCNPSSFQSTVPIDRHPPMATAILLPAILRPLTPSSVFVLTQPSRLNPPSTVSLSD
ncbi:hypothetical protein L1987_08861 [Smallanthus sonchifolius]|uniref:Uncharacterized protein n=1 Tax=Smallanthus sonchifolius TaxID=185202 RepID=A0ACB9JMD2_9ASTR|nr:hypothetical protein L1987_08861 [Smallanthus sonchifolius]